MPEVKDIGYVVKSGLCTGCGTCEALCPQNAIRLEIDSKRGIYLPRINETICNACGTCLKVCPGHEGDFTALNQMVFGRQPQDNLLGNYMACYTGHAADKDIRYHCSSGGLVSSLLIFGLECKLIDGALVTRMNPKKPLEPQPFIARNREEILEAAGSKYCPVPANIALGEILKAREGEKFAVVGLPCHMHGLRKAELANKKLRERIALRIGLFCGSTSTFSGTRFILRLMGIKQEDVTRLDFRGAGWPGDFSVEQRSGHLRSVSYSDYVAIWNGFFIPTRCSYCPDGTAELADISFGDAWLPRFGKENIGESILLCRTRTGHSLLEKASALGVIELKESSLADVLVSQTGMLYRKKGLNQAGARLFGKRTSSSYRLPALNPMDYAVAIIQRSLNIYNTFPMNKVLEHMPSRVMKLHSMPMAFAARYFYFQRTGEGLRGFLHFIFRKFRRIK